MICRPPSQPSAAPLIIVPLPNLRRQPHHLTQQRRNFTKPSTVSTLSSYSSGAASRTSARLRKRLFLRLWRPTAALSLRH
uniref:Uncharacterized protein n=1 Tax=Kalanchoe fedtschenkoi TaxID=63787 RepID=A0A7N0VH94_KALFE